MKTALTLAFLLALTAPAAASDVPVTVTRDTSGALPTGVKKVEGKVLEVVSWTDAAGENRAVFSATEKSRSNADGDTEWAKSLFVTVFSGHDGKLAQVRQVKEVAGFCPVDLTNRFLPAATTVTDLDDDGVGELTFVYLTGCRGDVSPVAMKLILLEGSAKFAIRGTTRVDVGGGTFEGGTAKPDFKKAPAAFLAHAQALWSRFVDERFGDE